MGTNYFDTFIAVAPDYDGESGRVPAPRGGKATVAVLQYSMLIDAPFEHTQEDVLFGVWLQRQGLGTLSDDAVAELRSSFFAQDQACLRASPLTKTHGWGVVFDEQGRAALIARDSDAYRGYSADPDLKVLNAMRSKRG